MGRQSTVASPWSEVGDLLVAQMVLVALQMTHADVSYRLPWGVLAKATYVREHISDERNRCVCNSHHRVGDRCTGRSFITKL